MPMPWKKIVCPTDFSEPSRRALEIGRDIAVAFGGELLVVHVVSPAVTLPGVAAPESTPTFNVGSYVEDLKEHSRRALQDLVARVAGTVATRTILREGHAAMEIVALAREEAADLIVIATHGRTGWRRILFGSVAEAVIRHADRPVLAIPVGRRVD